MARFSGDATFGLDDFGEADAPNSADGEGFDLDRDAVPEGFDMKGLDDSLPGLGPEIGGGLAGMPGMPPGLEDLDEAVLQDLMSAMGNGMPDPVKIQALMRKHPPLQKFMAGMMGDMMGGMGEGLGGPGGMGGPGMAGPGIRGGGSGRATSQREKLQERLRQKREISGEGSIPEVKSGGKNPSASQAATPSSADDDDWLVDVPKPAGTQKKSGGKKKGGKKR